MNEGGASKRKTERRIGGGKNYTMVGSLQQHTTNKWMLRAQSRPWPSAHSLFDAPSVSPLRSHRHVAIRLRHHLSNVAVNKFKQ